MLIFTDDKRARATAASPACAPAVDAAATQINFCKTCPIPPARYPGGRASACKSGPTELARPERRLGARVRAGVASSLNYAPDRRLKLGAIFWTNVIVILMETINELYISAGDPVLAILPGPILKFSGYELGTRRCSTNLIS